MSKAAAAAIGLPTSSDSICARMSRCLSIKSASRCNSTALSLAGISAHPLLRKAARAAFRKSGWAEMPANDRAVLLHRLADLIDKHRDILAQIESLDVGKPIAAAAAFDIPHAAQTFRYYADLSVHTRRREPIAVSGFDARTMRFPCGVCGFIFPWNFPFLLVGWGVAPALAAGNTVVIKPAEDTPLSTLYFAKLAEEAGLPPGAVNVVTGLGHTAGAALAAH